MKLNPPETAPKDGTLFLGAFSISSEVRLQVAHWDKSWFGGGEDDDGALDEPHSLTWIVFDEKLSPDEGGYFYLPSRCLPYGSIKGWLPLPQIDSKGNAVFV